jgi:hypothetical protein
LRAFDFQVALEVQSRGHIVDVCALGERDAQTHIRPRSDGSEKAKSIDAVVDPSPDPGDLVALMREPRDESKRQKAVNEDPLDWTLSGGPDRIGVDPVGIPGDGGKGQDVSFGDDLPTTGPEIATDMWVQVDSTADD